MDLSRYFKTDVCSLPMWELTVTHNMAAAPLEEQVESHSLNLPHSPKAPTLEAGPWLRVRGGRETFKMGLAQDALRSLGVCP